MVLCSTFYACPYVVSAQHGQVEGQQLQRDDAEDALQAVHRVRQLDRLVGVLHDVLVVTATQDDGAPLRRRRGGALDPSANQHRVRAGAPPPY